MPTKEYYLEQIEKEFTDARKSLADGNDGRVRVCVRRAAGQAITWFLTKNPRIGWGNDAMNQLNHLKADLNFPENVRDAGTRLTTKITDQFVYPFSNDPLADGKLIIDFIIQAMSTDDV